TTHLEIVPSVMDSANSGTLISIMFRSLPVWKRCESESSKSLRRECAVVRCRGAWRSPPPDWTARDDRHSERLFPQAPWRATGVPHRSRRPCSSVLPGPKPFPAVGENAAPPGGSPPPETDTAVPPARDASAPRLVRPPTSLPTP